MRSIVLTLGTLVALHTSAGVQEAAAQGDRVRSDSVAWFKPKLVEMAELAATKLR